MPDLSVGFVIFPELTQLDFTGPLQVLARLPGATTHIVAKSEAPVPSDCGLSLVPTCTFANCPPLDLICVPGGVTGVIGAIGDRETVEFVRQQAVGARYVTSVCTGAFVLGAAGLLWGRRATTHWAYTLRDGEISASCRYRSHGRLIGRPAAAGASALSRSTLANFCDKTTRTDKMMRLVSTTAPPSPNDGDRALSDISFR